MNDYGGSGGDCSGAEGVDGDDDGGKLFDCLFSFVLCLLASTRCQFYVNSVFSSLVSLAIARLPMTSVKSNELGLCV